MAQEKKIKSENRKQRSFTGRFVLGVLAIGVLIGALAFASLPAFQSIYPAQQMGSEPKPAQQLQKFKASVGNPEYEGFFLVEMVGKEQGIWANNGLDPEFVYGVTTVSKIKEHISSGLKIGLGISADAVLAGSDGAPIKVVASYIGVIPTKIFVKADGPIKTVKDLDGKKIGVYSLTSFANRHVLYASQKFAIKTESVPIEDPTSSDAPLVAALKVGKIDAYVSARGHTMRLVDSGELRILLHLSDVYAKPYAANVVFATEDLIEQNPDLVKRFVKATLETVKYISDNPSSAANVYVKKTNAPKDLANKAVSLLDWQPSGRGSGQDLFVAVSNAWQGAKDSGAVPPALNVKIEDAVDVRFLP